MSNVMYEEPQPKCELCGQPMPLGEENFKYHGYSGPCPKPINKGEQMEKCKAPMPHHYVPSPVIPSTPADSELSWVCVNCGDVIYVPFTKTK